jgi:SAM-dependent methyltransferase
MNGPGSCTVGRHQKGPVEALHVLVACAGAVAIVCVALAGVVMYRRWVYPAPFPPWMTPILDRPSRRRKFSPERAAERHGIEQGMRVLEIGPGGGYLTAAAQQRVGPTGMLVCLDIQLAMLEKLRQNLGTQTPALVCAPGTTLPLADACIDLVFLCEVLGEIRDKRGALGELYRVIRPGGTLAVTEAMPDPDYVRCSVLTALAVEAGFEPTRRFGTWSLYTQRFTRPG